MCGCIDSGNVLWVNYTRGWPVVSLPPCSEVIRAEDDAHQFNSAYVCEFERTSGEPRPSPWRLHLLPCMGQHVIALGLVDQIAARLRGFDQLLVVHHVQQVGRVDEGKTHHRQQLRQILRRHRKRNGEKDGLEVEGCNL